MSAVVVIVACYGVVLVGIAAGLHRLGRISTSPWASRVTLGHRRAVGEEAVPEDPRSDWPHSDAPVVYTAMGLVAAVAAVVLCLGVLLVHHKPFDIVVLVAIAASAGWMGLRLAQRRSP